jgi:hypothetical protein
LLPEIGKNTRAEFDHNSIYTLKLTAHAFLLPNAQDGVEECGRNA